MTNYEAFKDEIIKIIASGKRLSVRSGKPVGCSYPCFGCLFYNDETNGETCKLRRRNWLESEYKEPVKLNEQERLFCEMIEDGYISRDKSGNLYWFELKPIKNALGWVSVEGAFINFKLSKIVTLLCKNNLHFDFIKWENKEPWSVKDILEVVEDED